MNRTLKEASQRIPSIKNRILEKLRKSGKNGCTNLELQEVGISWDRRIQELYKEGYIIDNSKYLGNGIYVYVLVSEPEQKFELISAKDQFFQIIDKDYNGCVSVNDILEIFEQNHIDITRSQFYFKDGHFRNDIVVKDYPTILDLFE